MCRRIKPFDAEAVAEFAASVDHVVTAENHVVVGGLASLVVETLFDAGVSRKVTRIGLPDRYIECGAVPTLQAQLRPDDRGDHRDDRRPCGRVTP